MCFDRNINGNRNDKFFDWDYWSLHRWKNLTLVDNRYVVRTSNYNTDTRNKTTEDFTAS